MAGGVMPPPAPWKQLLLTALESNSHHKHSSFLQLATIGSNGRPSNRTVVFRGFADGGEKIQINTDGRSRKLGTAFGCSGSTNARARLQQDVLDMLLRIEELNQCPFGEICWYFTNSWEQFRINGSIDVIDGSNPDNIKLQQREKSWFASSLKSRGQYLGSAPGLPCVYDEAANEKPLDPSVGPVDAFCLLLFDPDQVDYLNLKSNERFLFTSNQIAEGCKHWVSEKVNP